jgi:hypothetical protein
MAASSALQRALKHAASGKSVIALTAGEKYPTKESWKAFARRRATEDELRSKLKRRVPPKNAIQAFLGRVAQKTIGVSGEG